MNTSKLYPILNYYKNNQNFKSNTMDDNSIQFKVFSYISNMNI